MKKHFLLLGMVFELSMGNKQTGDVIKTKAFKTDFINEFERYKNGTGKERMKTRQYSSQEDTSNYLVNWLNERKEYLDSIYLNAH